MYQCDRIFPNAFTNPRNPRMVLALSGFVVQNQYLLSPLLREAADT